MTLVWFYRASIIFGLGFALAHSSLPPWGPGWTFQASADYIRTEAFDASTVDADIVRRSHWGAASPDISTMKPLGIPDGIVVHHSATGESATVLSIQQHHMRRRNWSDIAYHFLIRNERNQSGQMEAKIYEGRLLDFQGAHAGAYERAGHRPRNMNPRKIGICLIGAFSPAHSRSHSGYPAGSPEWRQQPNPSMVQALARLTTWLHRMFPSIYYTLDHNMGPYAVNPKQRVCPGDGVLPLMNALVGRFTPSQPAFDPTQEGEEVFEELAGSPVVEVGKAFDFRKTLDPGRFFDYHGHRAIGGGVPGEFFVELSDGWHLFEELPAGQNARDLGLEEDFDPYSR